MWPKTANFAAGCRCSHPAHGSPKADLAPSKARGAFADQHYVVEQLLGRVLHVARKAIFAAKAGEQSRTGAKRGRIVVVASERSIRCQ
jgi:hypothetical protein